MTKVESLQKISKLESDLFDKEQFIGSLLELVPLEKKGWFWWVVNAYPLIIKIVELIKAYKLAH